MSLTAIQKAQARLDEVKRDIVLVRQAIRHIYEAGQSVGISGGISYTSASLTDLRKEERELLKERIKLEARVLGNEPTAFDAKAAPDFSSEGPDVEMPA